jgi:hypothetical protein
MREQRRACAVLGLGPFARSVIDALPPGAFVGPVSQLELPPAGTRAGHDWLPPGLRGPLAPPLQGTRPGGRLDVLSSGRTHLATHVPALRAFRDRCHAAGVTPVLLLVAGLFDPQAAGILDLAAMLRATEALDGVQIVLFGALSPPSGAPEPHASSRAALTLQELDAAAAGATWELPQPTGVLRSSQSGSSLDGTLLVWPSGPRWSADEAAAAVADAMLAAPWLPTLPLGGLGAIRALPVRAPAADVRERLADRLAALSIDRWLGPGAVDAPLEVVEGRLLVSPPRTQDDWLAGVRARLQEVVGGAAALAVSDPEAAADRVRGTVPALDRELQSEIGAEGPMRRSAEDAARRWTAGARAQALAVVEELCARSDGGGFALIALAQQAQDRLSVLRDAAERQIGASDPGSARAALDAATERLRAAIDKPAGLTVRLLGRGAPRLLEPLQEWNGACEGWAEAIWAQAAARVEAGALAMLLSELRASANALQEFEVQLRSVGESARRGGRAANQRPVRGVVVLPGGAVDPDEAAERLERLGAPGGGPWLKPRHLLEDPAPRLLELQEHLRTRLGAAEAQLTLAGALASLPEDGPSRAALDRVVGVAQAPLLAGDGREELVAVLPPDVDPQTLRLPEGTLVARAPRRDDGILVRLAGGFRGGALGLRKAALDEGLSRHAARDPDSPDLSWRRFPG